MKYSQSEIAMWEAYEAVRAGGKYNMFDPRARQASGLSQAEYGFCMDNYSALKAAAERRKS